MPSLASRWLASLALLISAASAVGGCGSPVRSTAAPAGKAPKGQQSVAEAPLATVLAHKHPEPPPITVTSAVSSNGGLRRRSTCAGATESPPVRWAGLPRGTKEIVVFVETLVIGPPYVNWAVAGINPETTDRLLAGRLPLGAIVGRNSAGRTTYAMCPTAKSSFVGIGVVALLRPLNLHRGFDAAKLLTEIIKPGSHHGSTVIAGGGRVR